MPVLVPVDIAVAVVADTAVVDELVAVVSAVAAVEQDKHQTELVPACAAVVELEAVVAFAAVEEQDTRQTALEPALAEPAVVPEARDPSKDALLVPLRECDSST